MFCRKIKICNCFLVALFLSGCATTYAPEGWLPETEDIPRNAFGGWLTLWCDTENLANVNTGAYFSGEFISVDSMDIYLFTETELQVINKKQIKQAVLELDDKNTSVYGLWSFIGTLSTISHGFYLAFSAPLWIITWIATSAGESYRDYYEAMNPDDAYWENIRKFARFPQGIPEAINPAELKPKKLNRK